MEKSSRTDQLAKAIAANAAEFEQRLAHHDAGLPSPSFSLECTPKLVQYAQTPHKKELLSHQLSYHMYLDYEVACPGQKQ